MIFWAFLVFFSVSIVLMCLGLWTGEQEIQVVAFAFLFLPAWALMGVDVPLINDVAGIQYHDGNNISTTYTYNATASLTNTVTTEQNNYTSYSNRPFGLILLLAAFGGFIVSLMDIRNANLESGGAKSWLDRFRFNK